MKKSCNNVGLVKFLLGKITTVVKKDFTEG